MVADKQIFQNFENKQSFLKFWVQNNDVDLLLTLNALKPFILASITTQP